MRSGQQAALGQDLVEFMDAMKINRAILAGYDWGGRAACIAAALSPERDLGLVTAGGTTARTSPERARPPAAVGAHVLVPVLLPLRARTPRTRPQPRRALRAPVAHVVADVVGCVHGIPASAPSLHNPDFIDGGYAAREPHVSLGRNHEHRHQHPRHRHHRRRPHRRQHRLWRDALTGPKVWGDTPTTTRASRCCARSSPRRDLHRHRRRVRAALQ